MRHAYRAAALIFFFVAAFAAAAAIAQTQTIDKIAAVVGDRALLQSDIEDQYQLMRSRANGTLPPEARCAILDQMLLQDVLVVQGKLDSVKVPEERVEQQLAARMEQILGYMGGSEERFREYYGMGIPEAKEKFRDDLSNQILAQEVQSKIMDNVNVTPAEVKAFYALIPADSLPYFNSEVEFAQIVIKPKVNEKSLKAAREQAASLRERIVQKKEDFAELAKKYSDDKGSGAQGGDLGWAKRGSYVPEFEAALFKLNKGEYSTLVKTVYGYHLIQLIERRGNSVHARHILVKPEILPADLTAVQQRLDSLRTAIEKKAITFAAAVQVFSDDDNSKTNGGTVTNPNNGNAYFEVGELTPDVYFALDSLQTNGITHPLEFQTSTGEAAYRIVQLKSRSEPHQASLETDYNKIKTAALEQKKSKTMGEWLQTKTGKVYIRISPEFKECPALQKWQQKKTE